MMAEAADLEMEMEMQSFLTNDGVKLRYFDTGAGNGVGVEEAGKEWLIMVCVFVIFFSHLFEFVFGFVLGVEF